MGSQMLKERSPLRQACWLGGGREARDSQDLGAGEEGEPGRGRKPGAACPRAWRTRCLRAGDGISGVQSCGELRPDEAIFCRHHSSCLHCPAACTPVLSPEPLPPPSSPPLRVAPDRQSGCARRALRRFLTVDVLPATPAPVHRSCLSVWEPAEGTLSSGAGFPFSRPSVVLCGLGHLTSLGLPPLIRKVKAGRR